MNDPNGFEFWRERHAEMLREVESHGLARRVRMAPREGANRRFSQRIRAALRIAGEAT